MSPLREAEGSGFVVEGQMSFQGVVELHASAGEAEALWLGRDLQAAAVPLHDVVVADDALVDETADAIQLLGSGPPSFVLFPSAASEAAVIVGHKAPQDFVGRREIASLSQAQLAAQAVLEDSPEPFDAPFGLGSAGGAM